MISDNDIIIYCTPEQKCKILGCLYQGTFCIFKKSYCGEKGCHICIEKHTQFRNIRDIRDITDKSDIK